MTHAEIRTTLIELFAKFKSKSYPRIVNARQNIKMAIEDYCSSWALDNMSEMMWLFMNNEQPAMCAYGNKLPFKTYDTGYRQFCSLSCKCKRDYQSATLIDFWDGNDVMKKQIMDSKNETNMERYGVNNHMQNEEALAKVQAKMIENYGAKSNIERSTVVKKVKAKHQLTLGVEYPFLSDAVQAKSKATFETNHQTTNKMQYAREAFALKHAGKNAFQVYAEKINAHWASMGISHNRQSHIRPEVLELISDKEKFTAYLTGKTMYEMTRDLSIDGKTIFKRIDQYGLRELLASKPKSAMEFEMQEMLEAHHIPYIRGNRSIISPLEIDFYFPDIKLGVELNGLYWHSDRVKKDSYHYDKFMLACEKEITLLQYWSDEWEEKKHIIFNKILHLHGKSSKIIGARKLKVEWLDDFKFESEFLNQYHIQGMSNDRTKVICAKDNQSVVAVMAVKLDTQVAEVTRFATNGQASYPGLFTKMLSWFKNSSGFGGDVISFSDNFHSNGAMYANSGFIIDSVIAPGYYVSNGTIRWRRERFRKQSIKKNYPDVYDETLTESEMIDKLKFFRVWDAGKIKWRLPGI